MRYQVYAAVVSVCVTVTVEAGDAEEARLLVEEDSDLLVCAGNGSIAGLLGVDVPGAVPGTARWIVLDGDAALEVLEVEEDF